jgi:hypothetical protein
MNKFAAKTKAIPYSDTEIERLRVLWVSGSMEEIKEAFPNRSLIGLGQKAKSLGLECKVERARRGDLSVLLDKSLTSFYWLGFILADGHFTKTGQLVVALMEKDKNHLEHLAQYLKTTVKYPYRREKEYKKRTSLISPSEQQLRSVVRITVQDKEIVDQINFLLGLPSSRKTYNPPTKLDDLNTDEITALFIGFFDGDGSSSYSSIEGCVRKSARLENHISWKPVFEIFRNNNLIHNAITHKNKNTVSGHPTKTTMMRLLAFATEYKLPILIRKWSIWFDESNLN